ncbi:hypothetical protein AB4179_13755 [Vibrio lentus]|nr:hypothetical protein BCT15_15140 [Vibrio splendidus]
MSISIEYILVLFLLAVILVLIPYIPKTKIGKRINNTKKIKVKEKVYLDNTTKLYVVDYEGVTLFVASNSSSISISVDKKHRGYTDEY